MHSVDISFTVTGNTIPADHGFALYGALSGIIPAIHSDEQIGIHPINGMPAGNRRIALTPASRLTVRLPAERIKDILVLSGKQLRVDEAVIRIGTPTTRALIPAARLYSRLVVIKGFTEPMPFLNAVQRQLDTLGVKGKPALVEQSHIAEANKGSAKGTHSPFLRRTIKIHNRDIVGFALKIEELTAEESITIQEKGIGGRRRFGCGVFIAVNR